MMTGRIAVISFPWIFSMQRKCPSLIPNACQDSISIEVLISYFHIDRTEMLIITGNTEQFQAIIDKPLAHAKNFEDRLPASHNYVRFLVSLGRFEEALDACFSILREFGEDFPTEVTQEIIQAEVVKTETLLANFPKDDLLHLPQLTDPMKCWLMKIMNSTMLLLFSIKEEYAPLVGCRMAQRSATYGWGCDSAFGLYSFGQALISVMNNVDDGSFW